MTNNNSVGEIWCDLVNQGLFNAFLTPDPFDGGAPSGSDGAPLQGWNPVNQQDLLNNNGSGWFYNEILHEVGIGIKNIGMVGYSHGGGMAANVSWDLKNISSIQQQGAGVVFADTIDAVEYGRGPDEPKSVEVATNLHLAGSDDPWPLQTSPDAIWGGTQINTINYYETNGFYFVSGNIAGAIKGMNMPNARNYPISGETHSSIGVDEYILQDVEGDIPIYFGMLSN